MWRSRGCEKPVAIDVYAWHLSTEGNLGAYCALCTRCAQNLYRTVPKLHRCEQIMKHQGQYHEPIHGTFALHSLGCFSQMPQMSPFTLLGIGSPYNPAKTAWQTNTAAPNKEQKTKKKTSNLRAHSNGQTEVVHQWYMSNIVGV